MVAGFYVECVCIVPTETYAPWVIDANGTLPGPFAFQLPKPIAGWNSQIIEHCDELIAASFRRALDNVGRNALGLG